MRKFYVAVLFILLAAYIGAYFSLFTHATAAMVACAVAVAVVPAVLIAALVFLRVREPEDAMDTAEMEGFYVSNPVYLNHNYEEPR